MLELPEPFEIKLPIAEITPWRASFRCTGAGYLDRMGEQKKFHKGDHVSWASHSGRGHGVVQDEITERTKVRGRTVNASKEEPQYRIRNDDSGKDVAHKPGTLRREQG